MIRGKFLTSQDDVRAVMDIRRRVFVDEQGYSADTEIDGFDKMAVYALALSLIHILPFADAGAAAAPRPGADGRAALDHHRRHTGAHHRLCAGDGAGVKRRSPVLGGGAF